jgi:hypothetical protein
MRLTISSFAFLLVVTLLHAGCDAGKGMPAKASGAKSNSPIDRLAVPKSGGAVESEIIVDLLATSDVEQLFARSSLESLKVSEQDFSNFTPEKMGRLQEEAIQVCQNLKSLHEYCKKRLKDNGKYGKASKAMADFLTASDKLQIYRDLGSYFVKRGAN